MTQQAQAREALEAVAVVALATPLAVPVVQAVEAR